MNITTRTCAKHASLRNVSGNAAHAYREFIIGPARRCPRNPSMFELMLTMPPSIEQQQLDELRRIRKALEGTED